MNSRLPLFLLVFQIFQHFTNYNRKPIISIFLIALMSIIHLDKGHFSIFSSVRKACLSYDLVMYHKQYDRIFWHAVIHLSNWHLYYNMLSLLWKGATLEPVLGGIHYFLLIFFTIPLSAVIHLMITYGLFQINDNFSGFYYMNQCSAGFSGVLFSLRVVELSVVPGNGPFTFLGISLWIPRSCFVWLELLIIHFLEPNSSFIGHLSGIVAGLLYCTGPLNWFINSLCQSHIHTNMEWIPFSGLLISHFFSNTARHREREVVYDEPYQYPYQNQTPGQASSLIINQQELIRTRVLNATEKRIAQQKSRGTRT